MLEDATRVNNCDPTPPASASLRRGRLDLRVDHCFAVVVGAEY